MIQGERKTGGAYLLQQSYPHGSVCGGKHLHNNRDDLLLVLFC